MSVDNLEKLSDICRGLRNILQSPHDERVEEVLFLILQELRAFRHDQSGLHAPVTAGQESAPL